MSKRPAAHGRPPRDRLARVPNPFYPFVLDAHTLRYRPSTPPRVYDVDAEGHVRGDGLDPLDRLDDATASALLRFYRELVPRLGPLQALRGAFLAFYGALTEEQTLYYRALAEGPPVSNGVSLTTPTNNIG